MPRISRSLEFETMSNVAGSLRRDEREAVAAYLGIPAPLAKCSDRFATAFSDETWCIAPSTAPVASLVQNNVASDLKHSVS